MKFTAILSAFVMPAVVCAITTSYDPTYDKKSQSLTTVACSDGANGLITRGFKTFGDIPNFPNIGGAPAVTGWNSPACGTCWNLTYTNAQGVSKSVAITAVDHSATPDYNIALAAMNTLTNNQAVNLGRVTVTAAQLPATACGFKN
ncbi:eliciting plant response-like protein [Panaeolus papilionaceus]|nr:eliciting plant response-like protein [Panaeolus papilionaceus]